MAPGIHGIFMNNFTCGSIMHGWFLLQFHFVASHTDAGIIY